MGPQGLVHALCPKSWKIPWLQSAELIWLPWEATQTFAPGGKRPHAATGKHVDGNSFTIEISRVRIMCTFSRPCCTRTAAFLKIIFVTFFWSCVKRSFRFLIFLNYCCFLSGPSRFSCWQVHFCRPRFTASARICCTASAFCSQTSRKKNRFIFE